MLSVGRFAADPTPSIPMENFGSTNKQPEGFQNADDYDPFAHRDVKHPNSDFDVLVHLVKGSIGIGILAMPHAIRNAGLVFGPIMLALVGVLCTHCVHILIKSSHTLCKRLMVSSLTFAETAEMAFKSGPVALQNIAHFSRIFVDISVTVTSYGVCSVYVVFIATSIQKVIDVSITCNEMNDTRLYIMMFYIGYALLAQIKNLKYLSPFSALALFLFLSAFFIMFYYMFSEPMTIKDKAFIAPFKNMPTFFCTSIFAMEGICLVMPIENTMKHPQRLLGCAGIVNIAMSIVVFMLCMVGLFGYLRFGDFTEASITLSLPNETLANFARILTALAIFASWGLAFYVPADITWNTIKPHVSDNRRNFYETLFRLTSSTATVLLAVAIPNLGPIISLLGAVCFSILGLLCPAVIDTATNWQQGFGKFNWILWKNSFIIVLSIFALIFGTYTSIQDIIAAY